MVTSSAYRMKSSGGAIMASNEAKDPDNVQLWRMNVRRAEAEVKCRNNARQDANDKPGLTDKRHPV